MKTANIPADVLVQVTAALKLASAVCIIHSPVINERVKAADRALTDALAAAEARRRT